jgi:hypothetical protein
MRGGEELVEFGNWGEGTPYWQRLFGWEMSLNAAAYRMPYRILSPNSYL